MADRPKPSGDLIKQQADEIDRLRGELERAERERLQRQDERLRNDAGRRAGFRQAAPFPKGDGASASGLDANRGRPMGDKGAGASQS